MSGLYNIYYKDRENGKKDKFQFICNDYTTAKKAFWKQFDSNKFVIIRYEFKPM